MKRRNIISLIVIVMIILNFSGCGNKTKSTTVTSDVKKEVQVKENKVKKAIEEGNKFLEEKKFDEAKSAFQRAISEDKSNKNTYIQIKDKYIEKKRIDDAYYIVNLAIKNNVDSENMKKLASDIKSKFEITKLNVKAYENSEYSLPNKIKARINNEEKEVSVDWNTITVDTSKVGNKEYIGKIQGYDKTVQLNLNILPVKKVKKTIYAMGVFSKNNKRYLKTKGVEFFRDEDGDDFKAEREASKDGHEDYLVDGGLDDGYYIRDMNKPIKTYEISPKAKITVCSYMVNGDGGMNQQQVSYEKFKELNNIEDKQILSYIYLKNGVIVSLEQQYLP